MSPKADPVDFFRLFEVHTKAYISFSHLLKFALKITVNCEGFRLHSLHTAGLPHSVSFLQSPWLEAVLLATALTKVVQGLIFILSQAVHGKVCSGREQ